MVNRRFSQRFFASFLFISMILANDVSLSQIKAPRENFVDGAKQEGKLVFYATLTSNDTRTLLTAFERKYPFIKTTSYGGNAERLLNRISSEVRAGKYLFDVVNLAPINWLKKNGVLQAYNSVEASAYPGAYKDPQNFWVSLYDLHYVLGYNTSLVKQNEAPGDWEDLLDPKWRGKMCIDEQDFEWYGGMMQHWGQQKTRRFMKALSHQAIHLRRGHTLIAQLLAAGEFPLSLVYAHRMEAMKKAGAPVEWIKTTDPILVALGPIAIAAKAAHPNAAKLFIDFALSREGQLVLQRSHRLSGRIDLEPPPEMRVSELKLSPVSPGIAEELPRYGKEFREIFFP